MDLDNANGGNGNRNSSSSSEEDHSIEQASSSAADPPSLAGSVSSSSAYSTQTTASDHTAFPPQRSSLARNGAPASLSTESVQPSTSTHNVNTSSSSTGHVQPSTSAHFVSPGTSSTGQVQPSSPARLVRPSSGTTEGRSSPTSSLSDYVPSSSPAHFVAPGTSSGSPHAVAGSSRWTLYSPPPLPNDDSEEGGRNSKMSRRHSEERPSVSFIAERKRRSSVQEGSKSLQQKVTGGGSERKMSHEKLVKLSAENVSQLQRGNGDNDGTIDILQREQNGIRLLQKCYLNLIGSSGAGIEESGISDELMLQVYREIMDDLVLTFAQLDMSRFHELAGGALDWLQQHLSLERLGYLVQIIAQNSSEEPENEPS